MRHLFFSPASHESVHRVHGCIAKVSISIPPLFCLLMHRRGTDLPRRVYRSGELAPARATRRSESSPSPRPPSPLRDAPRHYRVPRHFLRGPFLWSETHPSRNSCQRAHMGPKISPKPEQKARNLPALRAGTLQVYAPGDPPPPFSAPLRAQGTHMDAMSQNAFIPTRETQRRSFSK